MEVPELYTAAAVAFDGTHADGTVELRSSDINDPPVCDPRFLSHEFERRVVVDGIRETCNLLKQPSLAKDQVRLAAGSKGTSEERFWSL